MLMKTRPAHSTDAPRSVIPVSLGLGPGHVGDEHQLDAFAARCAGLAAQHFTPEHRLYARGSAGTGAYIVTSGIVRFERVTAAGGRRIIRVAGQGDLIGQEALLHQAYRDDAVICTPSTLRRVSATSLDDAPWSAGRLPMALMIRWQQTLDESEFWSSEVTTGPSRRRVLQLLAQLQRHQEDSGLIWLPKRDQMGDMLNMTIETCSRVLSALRRDGILDMVSPRHAQLDAHRLAEALIRSNH